MAVKVTGCLRRELRNSQPPAVLELYAAYVKLQRPRRRARADIYDPCRDAGVAAPLISADDEL